MKELLKTEDQSSTFLVNKIFSSFHYIYFQQWDSRFSNNAEKEIAMRIWVTEIKRIKKETILRAIKRCSQSYQFPPSLPQFIEICNEVEGIVDPEVAFMKACNKDFSNDLIREAYKKVGSFSFETRPEFENKKKFMEIYKNLIKNYNENR